MEGYLFGVELSNAVVNFRVLLLKVLLHTGDSRDDQANSKDIQQVGGFVSEKSCSGFAFDQ